MVHALTQIKCKNAAENICCETKHVMTRLRCWVRILFGLYEQRLFIPNKWLFENIEELLAGNWSRKKTPKLGHSKETVG